jgi:hypothetical protein
MESIGPQQLECEKMNQLQRRIVSVGTILIAGMLLFPPVKQINGIVGFEFLLDRSLGSSIEIPQLLVQWLGVILVAGAVWVLAR